MTAPRGIVVVGSTGSIGRQALDVIRSRPHELRLVGIGARQNLDLLAKQVDEFAPKFVSAPAIPVDTIWHGATATTLHRLCELDSGERILVATVGATGLKPTLAAIRAGKSVALANKEVLVMAGDLIIEEARKNNAPILPVDSEHNAVWQCLMGDCTFGIGQTNGPFERIVLTASGGAFRDLPIEELATVTREKALLHPNWVMGPKVTIDSATLMNKGFEVIEAHWLFGVPYGQIDVLLHRESIVHALVEFVDGSVRAVLGPPDMRLPVQHALTFPDRLAGAWPRLKLQELGKLSFGPLDHQRYPCFDLALAAAQTGGVAPAVLSAADDVAVAAFLDGTIQFQQIATTVDAALQQHRPVTQPGFEEIIEADELTRVYLSQRLGRPGQYVSTFSSSMESTTTRG